MFYIHVLIYVSVIHCYIMKYPKFQWLKTAIMNIKYFKFYVWQPWVSLAACRLSLLVVSGLLIVVASLVAEHRLQGEEASAVATCRLSTRGKQA